MNTDKEKIYSSAVGSGIVIGMGISLMIVGVFYAVSQPQDKKIGGGIVVIGLIAFVAALFMVPPLEEINYLKGK